MQTQTRAVAMFIILVALTGCQFAERGKRTALNAVASFALDSFYRMQSPLAEGTAQRTSLSMTPASRGSATPAATIPPTPAAAPKPAQLCKKTCPQKLPVAGKNRIAMMVAAKPRLCREPLIQVVVYRPDVLAAFKLKKELAVLDRAEFAREMARMRAQLAHTIPAQPVTVRVEIPADTL